MTFKKALLIFLFCAAVIVKIAAQTRVSVPLENQIYTILEQAQLRGLCAPLSGVRPYTQAVVVKAINEILSSEGRRGLNNTEREILEQYLAKFSRPDTGLDLRRGAFYGETTLGEDTIISANVGISADIQGSAGLYSNNEYWGAEIWGEVYLNGDIGNNFSYGFDFAGGIVRAPRQQYPGIYNTYYEDFPYFNDPDNPSTEFVNRKIDTFSQPLTHFPYSYKKRWDSSVFALGGMNKYGSWPDSVSGGYSLLTELTGSFLDDKLILRAGRISHDWGSVPIGSSLALNRMARPFVALEAEFNPVPWFGIATLTGVLEYHNTESVKTSAKEFQNAFSVTMFQFRYKNYLFFDFVDTVVWPKRFEIGYMLPMVNNFMYQNNIGDFDNMALSFNLRAQYPGIGSIWASFFMDEMNFLEDLKTMDRQMFAWQVGASVPVPVLSFSSVKLSYTKINPYNYTHTRNFNPWYGYGDLRMETAYVNNGVSLGHYLPPNSDEILVRFDTMPSKNLTTSLQYQLIRHGADHGSQAVDGSNLLSELDPNRGNDNPYTRRFFLRDGAYQWQHVVRLGGEWTLPTAPISFYGEAGVVISYYTDIKEKANETGKAHSYSVVDTTEYPKATGFIAQFGVRIFPR